MGNSVTATVLAETVAASLNQSSIVSAVFAKEPDNVY
jgi:hypothetical protein